MPYKADHQGRNYRTNWSECNRERPWELRRLLCWPDPTTLRFPLRPELASVPVSYLRVMSSPECDIKSCHIFPTSESELQIKMFWCNQQTFLFENNKIVFSYIKFIQNYFIRVHRHNLIYRMTLQKMKYVSWQNSKITIVWRNGLKSRMWVFVQLPPKAPFVTGDILWNGIRAARLFLGLSIHFITTWPCQQLRSSSLPSQDTNVFQLLLPVVFHCCMAFRSPWKFKIVYIICALGRQFEETGRQIASLPVW